MSDSVSRPAVDVAVRTTVQRPFADVAHYATDPTNAPEWYRKISAVEWKTAPPVAEGSQVAFVARFLRRELRYTYQVVVHTPTTHVMRTAEGPFPMETTYTFSATAEGHTEVTLRNRGNPSGFSRTFAPFVRVAMRRAMRKDLQALKQRLET